MEQIAHPSVEDRIERGKAARAKVPRVSHEGWEPSPDRPDPVALLEEQNTTREPDLVPVRHGRMMVSPFTFYRGAAKIMAADLEATPTAGLDVQLCGDAHLSNFGVYASPERELVFDLNDFDETLPGPFEYDVKRMAASFTIAARNNGYRQGTTAAPPRSRPANAYRMASARVRRRCGPCRSGTTTCPQTTSCARSTSRHTPSSSSGDKKAAKAAQKTARKTARRPSRATACRRCRSSPSRSTASTGSSVSRRSWCGRPRRPRASGIPAEQIEQMIHEQFRAYRATLQDDRRHLLERFEVVDVARKVVGVGSVGTRAFIVLLQGRDQQDPLFLQIKEATASVLEDHLPKSRYAQPGERVVQGQRMMQAASDIFLGWTKGVQDDRYFYWRQLRDMKGSVAVEGMTPEGARVLRPSLRSHAGPRSRTLRRPDRARRVPRQEGPVRRIDHRLLPALRRSERARLRGVRRRDPLWSSARRRRCLSSGRDVTRTARFVVRSGQ